MDRPPRGDEPLVVVAGADPDDFDGVRRVVAASDGRVEPADLPATPDHAPDLWSDDDVSPAVVVAVGDGALVATARADPASPVLPVGCDRASESIPIDEVATALEAILDGDAVERPLPVLEVSVEDGSDTAAVKAAAAESGAAESDTGGTGAAESDAGEKPAGATTPDATRALFDVALVTAEPATISEFRVRDRDDETHVRADGVVVATPAGSGGYAHAAGGPALAAATEAVSVVPVSPFDTDRPRWVVPPTDLSITVERDEPLSLQVDGRHRARLEVGATVSIRGGDPLRLLSVDGVG